MAHVPATVIELDSSVMNAIDEMESKQPALTRSRSSDEDEANKAEPKDPYKIKLVVESEAVRNEVGNKMAPNIQENEKTKAEENSGMNNAEVDCLVEPTAKKMKINTGIQEGCCDRSRSVSPPQ